MNWVWMVTEKDGETIYIKGFYKTRFGAVCCINNKMHRGLVSKWRDDTVDEESLLVFVNQNDESHMMTAERVPLRD